MGAWERRFEFRVSEDEIRISSLSMRMKGERHGEIMDWGYGRGRETEPERNDRRGEMNSRLEEGGAGQKEGRERERKER